MLAVILVATVATPWGAGRCVSLVSTQREKAGVLSDLDKASSCPLSWRTSLYPGEVREDRGYCHTQGTGSRRGSDLPGTPQPVACRLEPKSGPICHSVLNLLGHGGLQASSLRSGQGIALPGILSSLTMSIQDWSLWTA